MKNVAKSEGYHPYLQNSQSGGVGEPGAPYVSPLDRVRELSQIPMSEGNLEPPREYNLGTMAHGLYEVHTQLESLRSEISLLKSKVRVFLPDHLFDSLQGCCGVQNYTAAGNLNSPVLQAVAELANSVMYIRDAVAELNANIVN